MLILSIDTSCDETAASVTKDTTILSNVVWSQASLHTKWGGVVPSIAKREHQARIDWVIIKAMLNAKCQMLNVDAIAVTVGPGLAIALEVGINKAKELAKKFNKPLIAVNHIEGHILSPLASAKQIPNSKFQILNEKKKPIISFPVLGVVTSGKHTELIRIERIGKYKILAQTVDDALGEALDKAARMLGFGYPGGHVIEDLAKQGNVSKYPLPVPLAGQEKRMEFSYSGIKAALYRKIEEIKRIKGDLTKQDTFDLASSFQKSAFAHFIRVLEYTLREKKVGKVKHILAGGGVMANVTLRKLIRQTAKKYELEVLYPYTKKLYGDNAAMIGIAAYFKAQRGWVEKENGVIDRLPNLKIDHPVA